MKKTLLILAILLCSCDDGSTPPKRQIKYTNLGELGNHCTQILTFEEGKNKCYVIDYCGAGSPTISCVKNELAP